MKIGWNKYQLVVNVISIMVAFLTHFPELIALSTTSDEATLFPGIHWVDVADEVIFTYISLLLLFLLNARLFHFGDAGIDIGWKKVIASFILVWVGSSLLGKAFVFFHLQLDIPAIDSMLHHYLHPLRDFLTSCIVTGSSYLMHQNRRSRKVLLENQQLRMENMVNQYESLKSQLNPHMLFNSLNTLYSLIRESPEKAQNYLQELSRVMRYTLHDNEAHSVTLKEEMDFVYSYIYLLQMRYEENLKFQIQITPDALQKQLPPMAIQMLVENAVKHNEISGRNPLTVSISANVNYVEVCNMIQPKLTSDVSTNIGLSNLAKRYQLLYKKEIVVKEDHNRFIVVIPLI